MGGGEELVGNLLTLVHLQDGHYNGSCEVA